VYRITTLYFGFMIREQLQLSIIKIVLYCIVLIHTNISFFALHNNALDDSVDMFVSESSLTSGQGVCRYPDGLFPDAGVGQGSHSEAVGPVFGQGADRHAVVAPGAF